MTERTDSGELDAIMAVIRRESEAFWTKDFAGWADCWAHVPYTRTMGYWPAGGISVVEGWEAQRTLIQRMMAEIPAPNPTAAMVRRENINARIVADMAWLTFDQYGADTGDSAFDMPGLSRETRILERHQGRWKLVYVGWMLEGPAVADKEAS